MARPRTRVCIERDCGALFKHPTSSRCPEHRKSADAARGRRQVRGYGRTYDAARRSYQQRMDAGERFTCWRCQHPIDPTAWTLGHCDDNRELIHGPEHGGCNYATAGRTTCPHISHQMHTGGG